MLSFPQIMATVSAACVLASCSSGSTARIAPTDAQRQTSTCNNYRTIGRSVQSSRRTENATCDDSQSSLTPIDPLYFDVESFQDIVDATQGADPCYAAKPRCGDDYYADSDNMIADPGGPAKRGDNCTPINGYAIGYDLGQGTGGNTMTAPGQPIPGMNDSATIVNQSQIFLENFSITQPVGWLLFTQGNGVWFVPNLTNGLTIGPLSGNFMGPGAYRISASVRGSRQLINAIRGVFNMISNQSGSSLTSSFSRAIQATGGKMDSVPCNTNNLA